jgi:hypothetical protein
VPALADRDVWVGHQTWTPDWRSRQLAATYVVLGTETPPADARREVARSGARFVLGICPIDLRPALGDLIVRRQRFGCVDLYELRARR